MKSIIRTTISLLALTTGFSAHAVEKLEVQKVSANTYALVGSMENRSAENLANNATFGVVVTSDGVLLVDSGGTYKGAAQIHETIKSITDQPVKIVVNSGGQDHRWMGNDYFRQQGARIIASNDAVTDQKARTQDQFMGLENLVGKAGIEKTEAAHASETFDESLKLKLGETDIEIYHVGQAHTPGDAFIWVPAEKVMFTGDIVYVERMLGVGGQSNSKTWMASYEAMAAYKPEHIVPGHGHATTLKTTDKDTYGYLTYLRKAVAEFMENGGDMSDISQVDQSQFNYLKNHETLAGRNAQNVFNELEWE